MAARAILGPLIALSLALGMLSVPGVAEAETDVPTLTLTEWCPILDGVQFYGVNVSLSGFPPNTPFEGSLVFSDGFGSSGSFTTDEFGNFGPVGVGSSAPFALATATVTYFGGTLVETLANPCQGPQRPTSKAQCKKSGFLGFGFKNQGLCVRFVATGGKARFRGR